MRDLVKIFKALSDQNRLLILKLLQVRPLCVCEITDVLGLATSTVSKHLSILRDAGFIEDQKDGKWVYYKLTENASDERIFVLLEVLPGWMARYPELEEFEGKARKVNKNALCSTSL